MSEDSMETASPYAQKWLCSVKVTDVPDGCPVPIWDNDLATLYGELKQFTNQDIVSIVVVDKEVFVQCETERKLAEFAESMSQIERWEDHPVKVRCEAVTSLEQEFFRKVATGLLPGRHMVNPRLSIEHAMSRMSVQEKMQVLEQMKISAGLPNPEFNPVPADMNRADQVNRPPSVATPVHDGMYVTNTVPKVKTFSGETPIPKGEVSYEQWRHEIICVRDDYSRQNAMEGVRRSLRGQAADMVRYLGPTATVGDVVDKLDVIYGRIATLDVLMQDFYSLVQQKNEKISTFVARLEGAMNHIRQLHPGKLREAEVCEHLKERLFHGMNKGLRNAVRFLYEGTHTDYYQLMRAARKTESEGTEARTHATTITPELLDLSLQQVNYPSPRPNAGNQASNDNTGSRAGTSTVSLDKQCYQCGGWGHFKSECPTRTQVRRGNNSGNSRGGQTRDMPVTPTSQPNARH